MISFQCFLRRGTPFGLSTARGPGPGPPKTATADITHFYKNKVDKKIET